MSKSNSFQNNLKIKKNRHSLSHLLAAAVLEKYPDTKLGTGPDTDNGFYYDFLLPTKISENDLVDIENRIRNLAKKNLPFFIETKTPATAKKIFKNQPFKLELIDELKAGKSKITIYKTGEIFTDLCAGPHVKNTKEVALDGFKLWKISGAYWRANENNQMMTRIYGLAFSNKEELKSYEKMLLEAAKRDHRKIGQEMDLFTFSPLVGSGLPLFTPKGTILRKAIVDKIQSIQKRYGYQEVSIPHLAKPSLYETSGHLAKFKDELFWVKSGQNEFVVKPMNCPHHTQIYQSSPKSYKDLPIRYTETTSVYRAEQSGELLGLSRVLSITQDDGHVFCAPDQIETEIKNIVSIIKEFYSSLEMYKPDTVHVSLSLRDPANPQNYLGSDSDWKKSENILRKIAKSSNIPFVIEKGEAAFYGPKLDFKFQDTIGREWQLATIQLDFNMPKRFNLEYTDTKGKKQTPIMIHRAIAGSLERFLSVIIEHFAGAFPLWLSPIQVKILTISDQFIPYAESVRQTLTQNGFRAITDRSNDTIGKKIRQSELEKSPYTIIIGQKEVNAKNISLRQYQKGDLGSITVSKLISRLTKETQ